MKHLYGSTRVCLYMNHYTKITDRSVLQSHSSLRNSLIYANNVLLLATVYALISERVELLKQKVEL